MREGYRQTRNCWRDRALYRKNRTENTFTPPRSRTCVWSVGSHIRYSAQSQSKTACIKRTRRSKEQLLWQQVSPAVWAPFPTGSLPFPLDLSARAVRVVERSAGCWGSSRPASQKNVLNRTTTQRHRAGSPTIHWPPNFESGLPPHPLPTKCLQYMYFMLELRKPRHSLTSQVSTRQLG